LPEAAKDIREQSTALAAKKQNTFYKRQKPIDVAAWTENSPAIMLTGLRAKFAQNIELARSLLLTGEKTLIEVPGRSKDRWSGVDGLLGRQLMMVRDELRATTTISVDDLLEAERVAERQRLEAIDAKRRRRAAKKSAALSSDDNVVEQQ
jgi:hypothetical protein